MIEPRIEIGAVAAEPAFGQNGCDHRRILARAQTVRIHDHARQTRRQCQSTQTFAFRCNTPGVIESIQFAQQHSRFIESGGGRGIEKR